MATLKALLEEDKTNDIILVPLNPLKNYDVPPEPLNYYYLEKLRRASLGAIFLFDVMNQGKVISCDKSSFIRKSNKLI